MRLLNILICAALDIETPCIGFNQLAKISKAIEHLEIRCIISLGSGSFDLGGKNENIKKVPRGKPKYQ